MESLSQRIGICYGLGRLSIIFLLGQYEHVTYAIFSFKKVDEPFCFCPRLDEVWLPIRNLTVQLTWPGCKNATNEARYGRRKRGVFPTRRANEPRSEHDILIAVQSDAYFGNPCSTCHFLVCIIKPCCPVERVRQSDSRRALRTNIRHFKRFHAPCFFRQLLAGAIIHPMQDVPYGLLKPIAVLSRFQAKGNLADRLNMYTTFAECNAHGSELVAKGFTGLNIGHWRMFYTVHQTTKLGAQLP